MDIDLDLKKASDAIKSNKARTVCIQLPDGLKQKANVIVDCLSKETDAKITIWAGSCFGACDIPNIKGFDMLIQWGHSPWKK